ncbi:MAG: ABC transporter substrate-binding protein [Alphaproteobacteria bacterium]
MKQSQSIRVGAPLATAILVAAGFGCGFSPLLSTMAHAEPQHAIAMHGEPALGPDFSNFPAANLDAPKGGAIAFAAQGAFDSLNPFIVKGSAPDGLWGRGALWGYNVWEPLMLRHWDEAFTLYGHLAEFVETPDDRTWVEFTMNPAARFSDDQPVTVEDVEFSFELLKEKGRPRGWIKKIDHLEKKPGGKIRFVFGPGSDRELPLIVALMPVFPKHAVDPKAFGKSSLEPMIGSGPYVVDTVEAPTTVTLKRNEKYWARDRPAKRGYDNFDTIKVEYIREANALFEAFKKGLFDINVEADPTRWKTGYDFPAAAAGDVVRAEIETGTPKGMNGFVFNLRNPLFQDVRVREALAWFLDFEWINRNLYESKYRRTGSFFEGSELSALGRPASARERELLAPYPGAVRADVMDGTYSPPVSDGSGRDRNNLRKGVELLRAAGYARDGDRLVHTQTGKALAFEILVKDATEERLALAYQRSLAVAGISLSVRQADASQYWERILNSREFDMIRWIYGASLSPGNEQTGRWSKIDADTFGRLNFAGVNTPAIDGMIDALLAATTKEDFVSAVRAYDRVLISGFYVIPLFNAPHQWVARWTRLNVPERTSIYGAQPSTWWAAQ